MHNTQFERAIDKFLASEAVTAFYMHLDLYNWEGVRALLDSKVSLGFGATEPDVDLVPVDAFMKDLINRNAGYQLGNAGTFHGDFCHVVEIEGDLATVRCKFSAAHWLGDAPEEIGTLHGVYIIKLVRREAEWKISRIWIKPIRWTGDARKIMDVAAQNWAAQSAGEK